MLRELRFLLRVQRDIALSPYHYTPKNIDEAFNIYKMPKKFLSKKEFEIADYFAKTHTKNIPTLDKLRSSNNLIVSDIFARVFFLDKEDNIVEVLIENSIDDFIPLLDIIRKAAILFKKNKEYKKFSFKLDKYPEVKSIIVGFPYFLS